MEQIVGLQDMAAAESAALGDSAPRILQHAGKRIGVRLEPLYWGALQEQAQSEGRKLNELVHSYYNDPRGADNRTAFIRRCALRWLAGELVEAKASLDLDATDVQAMLDITQRPALVVSGDMSFARCNDAFRDWILVKAGGDSDDRVARVRVSFKASLAAIRTRLEDQGGCLRGEPAAVLVPGRALPLRMDIAAVRVGPGEKGFMVVFDG